MLKKSLALLLICLMILTLALSGCSKPATEQQGGGETTAEEDVIKVGWMGSLTGDQAVWGQCELNTVKMLFEEINAKGGVLGGKKLEVIGYDTKGDPQEAVNVAKRLTGQDKVVAIIGPNASGSAIPIAPVLEEAKVPDIATVATNPKVTVQDGKVKPFNFRVCFIDPYQGAVAAGYGYDVLGFRKAAILYDVADDYSQGLTEFFEQYFVAKGGTIVAKEAFKFGDVDFRPQLSKIKEANPDVLFLPIFFKEAALIANQARELGITVPLMGGDGLPSEQLFTMAKDAVQGTYIVNHVDYDDPDVQDLKNRYRNKYGKELELNGYLAHDAVVLLIDAIERAGVADPVKITEALETADVQGVTGRIKIGKDTHNPEGKEAAIVKIEGDKYVFQQKYSAQLD
ncbi:MAG TPA: ABC transporter substrate-binding protein [Clostridiales bacterium]|nr:ABC transporter substrate-binding protein [Clostridiales bacterium]